MSSFRYLSFVFVIAAPYLSAQTTAPVRFSLDLQGKPIGKADYAIRPTSKGWSVTAHYSYNLQAAISATRTASYDKNWELDTESTDADTGPVKQALTLTANKARTSLAFRAHVGGQDYPADFPLQPHTVVLANFDPSGVQVLLNMQKANAAAGGTYQCFIPAGTGMMLACTLAPAAPGTGKLAGQAVPLQHWTFSVGTTTMDLWANAGGDLMQARVASQSVAYTREGFQLDTTTAVVAPPEGVTEREVTFPSDGLTVPGTLTLPAHSTEKFPIAVLVQGSGVQDRDETVGQNRVFQQLAWGLAQRGIATLRYDRRPKFAPANFAQHMDLDHEVVIDAASALAYCSTVNEANPKAIFLIGHSLGAQLAPYIVQRRLAEKKDSVRGYILMAGVETPIDQTILRQVAEFGKAQGATEAQVQEGLAKWQGIFAQVRDPKTPDDKAVGPGSVTAGYWRDWLKRDAAAEMKTVKIPALVLRGEYDRNVTQADFDALSAATPENLPQNHKEFPGLNHLFMPVSGPNADEMLPGKISPVVLDFISMWIDNVSHPDL